MDHKLSKAARGEFLEVVRQHYRAASREQKSRILDEVVALTGCHRKHAVRLLTVAACGPSAPSPRTDRRVYDEAVREALIVIWEAADRICGKRLKAVLPSLVEALERHGHLRLDAAVRSRLFAASAATLDRLLAPVRGVARGRKKRKLAKRSSQQVPIRTFTDWKDPVPGYLEIDFVAHGGSSMEGSFLWSLVATDVCSGWTEAVAVLAREQSLVVEGLEVMRRQFPVPILGIDSDNDSAFVNDTLVDYCQKQKIEFTRSRAYRKNDQAWIEQKNGAVIRRLVGYERYAGIVAGQVLAQLYQAMRLYVNFFQPSFQLRSKERQGAKVKKKYHPPTTPCERLLAQPAVSEATKAALRAQAAGLDPLELLQRIRASQAALAALSSGEPGSGPGRESLEQFLACLPDLWRQGEARPTHRGTGRPPRDWRTRKDPFEAVWPEVLVWLQESPDATAKSLFERLERIYPGAFTPGQLRTLQRRIRDWRRLMARKLVYAGCEEQPVETKPVGARTGEGSGASAAPNRDEAVAKASESKGCGTVSR
jgi:hypothetical protein